MQFYEKLSKLRKANNLSQEQLAEKLNVTRQAVSKWESGESYPDMAKIIQLCKILNCSLNELMDDGVMGEIEPNEKENEKEEKKNYLSDF
ncbi:MAG: helix-turn-helix domain-containing protein, partial [Solobacterium sp.]|nr:helix-turn-helix domain-containing protein [Solobacterium sp.]